MKICFMTLGCPNWDLETICRNGKKMGFDGVDFRGYLDTLDITLHPLFSSNVTNTRRMLDEAGLGVSCISSSIAVCLPEKLAANLEEARRTIPVALALGCQNVRIFGNGDPEKSSRKELAEIGRETIEQILHLEGADRIHWLFETHDTWVKAHDCRLLLDGIPDPAFGALWDMGHTYRVGGETPQETFTAIGSRVGYTHVKDAVYDPSHAQSMSDGWRYVFPGEGELPLAESIRLLHAHGYDGWLQFEHEKRWHPNLPEPEQAFPAFVRWARELLASL
jgi:sugar phosphate isomerase/epimerase